MTRPAGGKPAQSQTAGGQTESTSHFKRSLVPLDEYAARQGLSRDIIKKQSELGVVQIRKFKGQEYVVDVPFGEFLSDQQPQDRPERPLATARAPASYFSSLVTGLLVIVLLAAMGISLWLYIDSRAALEQLNADYARLQQRYEGPQPAAQVGLGLGLAPGAGLDSEWAASTAELARIQNQITTSRTQLDQIRSDLSAARRNLETIQSELMAVQGQLSLSRAEIETIQNNLSSNTENLDNLYERNARPSAAP